MLEGKKILLGITGSIAAYKSIFLVRELVKRGATVQVVCTPSALDFVTQLTLSTLSRQPVYSTFLKEKETGEWVNHVELGKEADLMLIAPLSANTLAKLSTGVCDNILLATYLSTDCPVFVAPAMDLDMYKHWTTQNNLEILRQNGVQVIDAESGELASGLEGQGRMAEPEHILDHVTEYFRSKSSLRGKNVLVTAGPTYERIDPVRFIGNFSSGKMGYEIAKEAARRGAHVTLVSGPSVESVDGFGVNVVRVESAQEMFDQVMAVKQSIDIFVMAAAVADYRPKKQFKQKQKKGENTMQSIELEATSDILGAIGKEKGAAKVVGFALESEHELDNANAKLKNKNADMLVMNSLKDEGAGFGTETNKVTFVFADAHVQHELKSKTLVAKDILNAIEKL